MPTKEKEEEDVYKKILGMSLKQAATGTPIEELDLLTTESSGKKTYNKITENVYRILKRHPEFKDRFRFNKWRQREEYKDGLVWRDLEDKDSIDFQREISILYPQFRSVGKAMVEDSVVSACFDDSYDVALQFIRKEEWDKKNRIDTWLSQAYGTPDDEYHRAVGGNFFKGMAKRIIEPGCKFDSVLIIEGKQGCGKSTSLTLIAGEDWHLETTMMPEGKDFFMQMAGKLIVEFSEGESFSRADTKKMKSVISTRFDTYRAPYGKRPVDVPRRCVFAMTTNNSEFLKDETGNRRFFPVVVEKPFVDLEWLKENRQQLFAEALYRVETLNENCYEYPLEAAEAIRAEKMIKTGLEDIIGDWLDMPKEVYGSGGVLNIAENGVSTTEVWLNALHGARDRFPKWEEMRVAQALQMLGMNKQECRRNGRRGVRWFMPKKSVDTIPVGGVAKVSPGVDGVDGVDADYFP